MKALIYFIILFYSIYACAEESVWKYKEVEKMNDPFFNESVFDWPETMTELSANRPINTNDSKETNDVKKILITAKCKSKNILPHTISRAFAWQDSDKKINIFLIYESVEVNDHLLITLQNGNASGKYWTWPLVDGTKISWNIKSLKLTTSSELNINSVLKGKIHVELNGKDKSGEINFNTIDGYIKPTILSEPPKELSRYNFN